MRFACCSLVFIYALVVYFVPSTLNLMKLGTFLSARLLQIIPILCHSFFDLFGLAGRQLHLCRGVFLLQLRLASF